MLFRSCRYFLPAILATGAPVAFGLPFNWDGSLASDNWDASSGFPSQDTNWNVPIGSPDSDDTVSFGAGAADFVVDLNGNRTVQSVSFTGTEAYTLNNSTLTLGTGDLSVGNGNVTHTINSGVTIGRFADWAVGNNATLEVNGVVSGFFGIEKTGAGTLRLLGDNRYGNNTLIQGGAVAISAPTNLGEVTQLAAILLSGGDLVTLNHLTFENHVIQAFEGRLDTRGDDGVDGFDLTIGGASTLEVDADGVVDLSGGKGLEDATSGRDGGTFEVAGGTFDLRTGGSLVSRGGDGVFSPPPGRTQGPNGRSGRVVFSGGVSAIAGTVDLSGRSSTFTLREGGDLLISGDAEVDITGTINLSGGATGGTSAGADGGDLTMSGGTVTIGDDALIDLSGGEGFSIGGEPDGNPGLFSINGGTVTFESDAIVRGTDGAASPTAGVNFIGARVNVDGGDLAALNDVLALTDGAVLNLSSGSLTTIQLRVENSTFNFTGGTLATRQFSGDLLQQGGTLAAGDSPGLTIVTGNYEHAGGDLEVELGGTRAGRDFDLYQINGDVDLTGGLLSVALIDSFTPEIDSEFVFLTVAGTRSGNFAGLEQLDLVGRFDGVDLYIDYTAGDGNDIALTTVPEPTSLALLGLGGLLVAQRRRR